MDLFRPADPPPAPVKIIQPCSEGCACFRPLPGGGWSDYGLCTNPRSPFHGMPVRLGRECADYRTDPPPSAKPGAPAFRPSPAGPPG